MDTNNNKALESLKHSLPVDNKTAEQREMDELRAALAAEKAKTAQAQQELANAKNKPTVGGIKVSPKGAVAIYGFGKWPVTLYLSQWEQLFDRIDDIKAFIEANRSKLTVKPSSAVTQETVKVS